MPPVQRHIAPVSVCDILGDPRYCRTYSCRPVAKEPTRGSSGQEILKLKIAVESSNRVSATMDQGNQTVEHSLSSKYDKSIDGWIKETSTHYSSETIDILENEFSKSPYIKGKEKRRLAKTLGLSVLQVQVWFQNRRVKERKFSQSTSLFGRQHRVTAPVVINVYDCGKDFDQQTPPFSNVEIFDYGITKPECKESVSRLDSKSPNLLSKFQSSEDTKESINEIIKFIMGTSDGEDSQSSPSSCSGNFSSAKSNAFPRLSLKSEVHSETCLVNTESHLNQIKMNVSTNVLTNSTPLIKPVVPVDSMTYSGNFSGVKSSALLRLPVELEANSNICMENTTSLLSPDERDASTNSLTDLSSFIKSIERTDILNVSVVPSTSTCNVGSTIPTVSVQSDHNIIKRHLNGTSTRKMSKKVLNTSITEAKINLPMTNNILGTKNLLGGTGHLPSYNCSIPSRILQQSRSNCNLPSLPENIPKHKFFHPTPVHSSSSSKIPPCQELRHLLNRNNTAIGASPTSALNAYSPLCSPLGINVSNDSRKRSHDTMFQSSCESNRSPATNRSFYQTVSPSQSTNSSINCGYRIRIPTNGSAYQISPDNTSTIMPSFGRSIFSPERGDVKLGSQLSQNCFYPSPSLPTRSPCLLQNVPSISNSNLFPDQEQTTPASNFFRNLPTGSVVNMIPQGYQEPVMGQNLYTGNVFDSEVRPLDLRVNKKLKATGSPAITKRSVHPRSLNPPSARGYLIVSPLPPRRPLFPGGAPNVTVVQNGYPFVHPESYRHQNRAPYMNHYDDFSSPTYHYPFFYNSPMVQQYHTL